MAYVRGARRSSLVKIIVVPEEPKPQRAAPKPKPVEAAPKPKPERAPAKCGTTSGYHRHLRLGEPPCEPCRAANKAASQLRRDRARAAMPPKPVGVSGSEVCGTPSGYSRHKRAGTPKCLPCRAAQTAHDRARYAERKAAA